MDANLSTAEVSRILGLEPERIRAIARTGLCRPARQGRRYLFSFRDLVVLRAAKELLGARVPAARVRRALEALGSELPPDRPLSGVRVRADGREVVVCDGRRSGQPDTGQAVFDFEVDSLARLVSDLREERGARAPGGSGPAAARAAFQRALDLEDADPAGARRAYTRALALDPDLVDALVNLGRLLHEGGDPEAAAEQYRLALERGEDDPIVHFNLALALEDTAGAAEAAAEYERALALDPDFADAHFNLAGLCEQLERPVDALRHYREYRRLRPR